jgi:alpha-glucosidase
MVRDVVDRYENALPAGSWPNWVLGNHDQPRIASRVGQPLARLAQLLLLALRGTPTLYYGDEIGMEDVPVPLDKIVDPQGLRAPELNRDPARSPMQWDGSEGAGFTTSEPWLPIADDYAIRNVAAQRDDPHSMLALSRRLLELRRASHALSLGDYASLDAGDQHVFAFVRSGQDGRFLVALNFGAAPVQVDLSALGAHATVAVSSYVDLTGPVELAALRLRPQEGLLLALEG